MRNMEDNLGFKIIDWFMMNVACWLIIGAVVVFVIAIICSAIGCSGARPAPQGEVVGKVYRPPYDSMILVGKVLVPQHHPEQFELIIQRDGTEADDQRFVVYVDSAQYNSIKVGERWARLENQ